MAVMAHSRYAGSSDTPTFNNHLAVGLLIFIEKTKQSFLG
jgi:hypothetical protein